MIDFFFFTPRDNDSQQETPGRNHCFPQINILFDFLSPGEILIEATVPFAIDTVFLHMHISERRQ